jgi:hypothetical protein
MKNVIFIGFSQNAEKRANLLTIHSTLLTDLPTKTFFIER